MDFFPPTYTFPSKRLITNRLVYDIPIGISKKSEHDMDRKA